MTLMNANDNPYIIEETDDFAVIFKPSKMHTSAKNNMQNFTANHDPLIQHELTQTKQSEQGTLLDWYKEQCPQVFDVMHRLDYETHGLVLFAKNEKSFNFFKDLQDRGNFIKEYSAICSRVVNEPQHNFSLKGFPQRSVDFCTSVKNNLPLIIESYFRPFGPGRKLVRPVIDDGKKHKEITKDKGGFYQTEIININENIFTVRIKRGFRHQIRCHLCWIGSPIRGDPLYSIELPSHAENFPADFLALRSHALIFADPVNARMKECRISPIYNIIS